MDLRSEVVMEIKKNDRVYKFVMPMACPFGEAYDAAFEALQNISKMAKDAADRAEQKKTVEPASDDK